MTSRIALPLVAALAMLLAACGADGGVRIVAVTAVTGTATPPPPGATPVAGSPTPPPVDLPRRPDNAFAGGAAVAAYLAGGRANLQRCLPELERAWQLAPVTGPRCVALDIDGDGRDELVYLVTLEGQPDQPGEAWFFDDAAAGFRLFSSARALANAILTGVQIVGVAEFTGDGKPEVVISARACTPACVTSLVIASTHRGTIENIAPEGASLEAAESVKIEDVNGDNLPDIVLRRQATAAVGPGPQRGLARVISWTGVRFAATDRPDPPAFLIHLLNDADAAFRAGDYSRARSLYERAATDTTLRDWKAEIGEFLARRELIPYSWFRAALAAQRQGDAAAARQLLARASAETGAMHGVAASFYLAAIDGGRPAQACGDAQRYLQQFAQAYQRFWDYGYANPERGIQALCS